MAGAAKLEDTAKVVRVVVLLLEGGVGAARVGVVAAAVERDVLDKVLGVVHGDYFVFFISTQQILPTFYLVGTPFDAVRDVCSIPVRGRQLTIGRGIFA